MKLCPKCQKQFSDDANFCPVDAARLVPLEGQAGGVDSLSARFTLGEKLGGGHTGAVHKATDKQGGGAVAIKLVAPAVVALPGVAQRLERELKQLERVQSAGVAKILASGKRNEEVWVALELLDGAHTLGEAIAARGPIPLEQAAHLVEVVGEALIEAAQVGVVHRDLAPKNVLFAGNDIKLINFSLPVPTTDKVPGVPEFVAPEQVDGKPVDQRSNLYSLGALYYYVLTGQTVHAGSVDEVHRAHANAAIKTPSSLAPVPAPVEAVIMRALDRSPTKRFLTVRQFVDEVGRVARGEASDPRATAPLGKSGGRPKAELVQTLLGVRSGAAAVPAIPASAAVPGAAPSFQPATPAAAVSPLTPPASAPPPGPAAMPSTLAGAAMPTGSVTPTHLQAPAMPAPVAVAQPSAIGSQAMGHPPIGHPPLQAQSGAATVMGVPSAAPERSPWAQPSAPGQPGQPGAMAGAQAAVAAVGPEIGKMSPPAVAPPIVAAPVLPAAPVIPSSPMIPGPPSIPPGMAPTIAPPQVANAPAGKRRDEGATKGKFRETMWFKKGDLDAQAAQAAAEERARTGKDVSADKADSLPIDERYKDDGSISRGDKEKYSLRTGSTQMMQAVRDPTGGGKRRREVSEDALIGEMKGGRNKVFAIIALVVIALGVALYFLLR